MRPCFSIWMYKKVYIVRHNYILYWCYCATCFDQLPWPSSGFCVGVDFCTLKFYNAILNLNVEKCSKEYSCVWRYTPILFIYTYIDYAYTTGMDCSNIKPYFSFKNAGSSSSSSSSSECSVTLLNQYYYDSNAAYSCKTHKNFIRLVFICPFRSQFS
jgi:hypothetical protein